MIGLLVVVVPVVAVLAAALGGRPLRRRSHGRQAGRHQLPRPARHAAHGGPVALPEDYARRVPLGRAA